MQIRSDVYSRQRALLRECVRLLFNQLFLFNQFFILLYIIMISNLVYCLPVEKSLHLLILEIFFQIPNLNTGCLG